MAGNTSFAEPVDFNREIRPLLADRCFYCHGPDEHHREADLRLDDEAAAKASVIVPGKPDASELITRIFSADHDSLMPPPESGRKLSPEERELIKRWVDEGAAYAPAWAYVAPKRSTIPPSDSSWRAGEIDGFILRQLQKHGLQPSPPADRATLIRRLSFDLTGLPPTPAEVDAFENDKTPEAYEKVVDRLLASEHFGERMAMYWLDLVRYADTVGYHGDQEHHISPYRDYVIEAFNQNLPFDQFTREQLAGDLLPESTQKQKIATGYNRMLQTSHEGGVQAKEYLAIYGADRVRNLSVVWMGATVGCCQCHDHKFDPYTLRDFYSLQAFFADVDEARHLGNGRDISPTPRLPEMEILTPEQQTELDQITAQLTQLKSEVAAADGEAEKRITELQSKADEIHKQARRCMITEAIEPRTIRVLARGNWQDDSGEIVEPAIPAFLGKLDVGERRANRLDLANWLTDPVNGVGGLTARVMANRIWYLLFGMGISRSLEDFGGQGEAPVHPELLDFLAISFYEQGWDVKKLIKQIVMSQAYQQTSSNPDQDLSLIDPENRFYSRQNAFRLPAEMIRDQSLAVGNLLVEQTLGESARPAQPPGYYRNLNFPEREYQSHRDQQQWRRGVYMHWQRQYLHPSLKAFDAPSREECTAERPRSNTPSAALVLLNDPNFIEASRAFAARILKDHEMTDAQKLDSAFRIATSRQPDDVEKVVLLELLQDSRNDYSQNQDEASKLISIGDSPAGRELNPVELAAWMQVTRALLNTSETITRN
ncbi:PSD1 and planctomycete cytochrome C domain-containing protein [Planctomicrobium sp. SH661]|uniref:PSD1 and planctomycete cytochrome C domain-containing protein n=1 Tax=Planctomicrobium sp. SH661 TaxID=3448124 RepID=UPI003F5C8CFC